MATNRLMVIGQIPLRAKVTGFRYNIYNTESPPPRSLVLPVSPSGFARLLEQIAIRWNRRSARKTKLARFHLSGNRSRNTIAEQA